MIVHKWTDGDMTNSEALRKTYVEHYAHVRSKVPETRLLEFESKDGWQPLCEFLGKKVPEGEPYPRVNDAKHLVQIHGYMYYLRLWHCTRTYVGAVGTILLAIGIRYWLKT
jgi:hypothetical protein